MLKKTISKKITTSKITEETIEFFSKLIESKKNETQDLNNLFHNKETMSIILYILSKHERTDRDIFILNSYLKLQNYFMQLFHIEEENIEIEEILTKINKSLKCESKEAHHFLFKIGNKGFKFYIILHGNVSVLIPKTININMSEEQYINYLKFLYSSNENYLLEKTLTNNKSIYPINKDKYSGIKENNIFNKDGKLLISLDEYISYINGSKFINERNNFFEEIKIECYIKVVDLKEGETFGEISLMNEDSKRTASIFINNNSLFGVLKRNDYKLTIKKYLKKIKRNSITFILNSKLFENISVPIFSKVYWNYFTKINSFKGDYLFKEGDIGDKIYFLYEGEIELKTKLNLKRINLLISYFGNFKLYKKDLKEKGKEEMVTLSIAKKGDLLGLSDNLYQKIFFCSAIISSDKSQIFGIDRNLLENIWKKHLLVKENFKNIEKKKENVILDRLLNIKKTYLSTMLGEFRDNKENFISIGKKIINIKQLFKNKISPHFSSCKMKKISINPKFLDDRIIKMKLRENNNNYLNNSQKNDIYKLYSSENKLNLSQKDYFNLSLSNHNQRTLTPKINIFEPEKKNYVTIGIYTNDSYLINQRIKSSNPRNLKKQFNEILSLSNKDFNQTALNKKREFISKMKNSKIENKTFFNYVDCLIMDKSNINNKSLNSSKSKSKNKKNVKNFVPINFMFHAKPLKIIVDKK